MCISWNILQCRPTGTMLFVLVAWPWPSEPFNGYLWNHDLPIKNWSDSYLRAQHILLVHYIVIMSTLRCIIECPRLGPMHRYGGLLLHIYGPMLKSLYIVGQNGRPDTRNSNERLWGVWFVSLSMPGHSGSNITTPCYWIRSWSRPWVHPLGAL